MASHWETEVLTTCALDYMTWDNFYSEGPASVGPTTVRRFQVDQPRDVETFNRLSGELVPKQAETTLAEQERWMRAQGPLSTALLGYLESNAASYDAFIFFGYLYATTYFGLPLVKDKAYLAPLAHDEWPIYFTMWDRFFNLPKGFIFQTPEERQFLARRFRSHSFPGPIAGVGIDHPPVSDPDGFREKYNLHRPFLLYVGRIDASKGCADLFDWFVKRGDRLRHFQLVLTGSEVLPVPYDPDIIYLGFVSEEEKWNAMAACRWLILPSEYESLSISLLETWMVGRPAIVNAKSGVLRGHCRRSNGGVWYRNWRECEAFLGSIDDPTMSKLGAQGKRYVAENYTWDRVESTYVSVVPGKAYPRESEGSNRGKGAAPFEARSISPA
ncbi:MAG TPA: glycosyltransferase family 4 protein [Chthoniobacterales bacterium]|jgi:glycosyltransferase involved in cell wall biosynthesis|nr:glycosyltransferase family 4 protein [Chthoniobacterales bacterium]